MQTVKILHCADVHIGASESFLGSAAQSRRFETLLTFERIIKTADEQNVELLLIAGDLFDSNAIEQTFIDRTLAAIASIPRIKVIFAGGNHDPITPDSPFSRFQLPENLYILDTEDDVFEPEDMGVRIYGRSFADFSLQGKPRFSILPPKDDKINIMVMHGELSSDLNSRYNSITQGFIAGSGMDYIALGHIHKRTGVGKIGDTYCAYCGCPEGQGFDETEEKGVYIGEVKKGGCDLQFVPISKRLHICESVDISECADTSETITLIKKQLTNSYGEGYAENLYKIILTGTVGENTDIDPTEIASRLSELIYFVKVSDRTEIKPDLEALAGEKTLKGIFVKRMLERIEKAEDSEAPALRRALSLGLKAFKGEVQYHED